MKVTKFRAWDGKLMHDVGELVWLAGGLKFYGPGVGQGIVEARANYDWKVDSILMQYTGLNDKNGKEIYEGDVVKWKGYEAVNGKQVRPVRIWEITHGYYRLFQVENIIRDNGSLEIIGNVHENPELSEGK